MTIHEMYVKVLNTPSDIQEHLETLRTYGATVEYIVELGVRNGLSTLSFLMSKPLKMTSYDIFITQIAKDIERQALLENINFELIEGNSLEVDIPECDLLFIDTLHTHKQLWIELNNHSHKVKKYIILHDTVTYALFGGGEEGIIKDSDGLMFSIVKFLVIDEGWKIKEHFTNNNGLTILERI